MKVDFKGFSWIFMDFSGFSWILIDLVTSRRQLVTEEGDKIECIRVEALQLHSQGLLEGTPR